MTAEDREAFAAAREVGLRQRHEQRLARAQTKVIEQALLDHERLSGVWDLLVHCRCGWAGSRSPDDQAHVKHQASAVQAALRESSAPDSFDATARLRLAQQAKRNLFTCLIATADRLDVPYVDAPEHSPWSLHVKPRMAALDAALKGEVGS